VSVRRVAISLALLLAYCSPVGEPGRAKSTSSAEDRRQSARVTRKPTAAELDQIAPLVVRIKSIPEIPRRDSSCRDCLSYNLDIEIDRERYTARLDDTTLPGSGLEELSRALAALLNRLLPPK